MIEKQNKRQFAKVMLLVISLIVLAFSSTYAYFQSTFKEPSITTATSGIFEVDSSLDTVNAIQNEKMILINENEVAERANSLTFTVTSKETSNVDGKFTVYLKDAEISKNLKSNYFHWELLKKESLDTEEKLTEIAKGTFENVTQKSGTATETTTEVTDETRAVIKINDITLNSTPIPLEKQQTVTLVFRLYLLNDPDKNQLELTEGSFSGRLYLEAVPVSALQKESVEG